LSLLVATCVASPLLAAADPLGFYIGGAVGQSTLRADQAVFTSGGVSVSGPISFSKHGTGWKLLAGLRPISVVGAELEYVDFGNPSLSYSGGSMGVLGYQANTRAKAAAVFSVLYAPIPLPFFDIYGKAGLARLQTTTDATGTFGCLTNCPAYFGAFHRDRTEARFAYGAGAQVSLGSFAVRVEYERISASDGDPSLLSVGLTWTF
jgi:hypothetical protein